MPDHPRKMGRGSGDSTPLSGCLSRGISPTKDSSTQSHHEEPPHLTILAALALAASAQAGCGKTSTAEGTLKSFDEKTKELTIAPKEGKATKVTLTPETKGADGVKDLVGKAVTVEVSVHAKSKALSVAAAK